MNVYRRKPPILSVPLVFLPLLKKENEKITFSVVLGIVLEAHKYTPQFFSSFEASMLFLYFLWISIKSNGYLIRRFFFHIYSPTDKDECLLGEHICKSTEACVNTIGSFRCSCSDEEIPDGDTCVGKTFLNFNGYLMIMDRKEKVLKSCFFFAFIVRSKKVQSCSCSLIVIFLVSLDFRSSNPEQVLSEISLLRP